MMKSSGARVEAAALDNASRELADALSTVQQLRQQLEEVNAEHDEAVEVMLQLEALYKQQKQCPRTEDLIELARLRQLLHDRDVEIRGLKSSSNTSVGVVALPAAGIVPAQVPPLKAALPPSPHFDASSMSSSGAAGGGQSTQPLVTLTPSKGTIAASS